MDIATAAALIIMALTLIVGCVWFLRNQRQLSQEEYYNSFEV